MLPIERTIDRIFEMESYLEEMKNTLSEIDDPVERSFFQAHFDGMSNLLAVQNKWLSASDEERPALAEQCRQLREKLVESLEVLKESQRGPLAPSV